MKYQLLICDLDDTLFDFHKGESIAIVETLRQFDIPDTPEVIALYLQANAAQWKKLERGETTQKQLRVDRFADFLALAGLERDANALSETYIERLGRQRWPLPYAVELCRRVSERMPIALVTNGISRIQRARLNGCELMPYVKSVFISEELGVSKPDPRMIYEAMQIVNVTDPKRVLVLGDSQTSDIAAANNAGADSLLFTNGKPIPQEHKATYAAQTLEEACRIILGE